MRLSAVCLVPLLLAGFGAVALADDGEADGLEVVVVTANRIPEPSDQVDASVTALEVEQLERAGIDSTAEAAERAPNVRLVDFTARAVSNARFRGVGGSTTNPGVTTYLDGVPQLSADTASQELLDVERIELVRGAQGTLYGRNTLGGVLNQWSVEPDQAWRADGSVTYGDFDRLDFRAALGGPVFGELGGVRLAYGEARRDGYTRNTFTGHDLDDRAARFYKAQAAAALDGWGARLIVRGESANDGDFALGDLAELRRRPNRVSHDFEGRTQRDVAAQTLNVSHHGESAGFESITGFVDYRASESTDLDATEEPDLTRRNDRDGSQLTQELRALTVAPQSLFEDWAWSGQAGLFGFTQDSDQNVMNVIRPSYLIEGLGVALPQSLKDLLNENLDPAQDRTHARLDDLGIGGYAQGTLHFRESWDATVGLRYDVERKRAEIDAVTALPLPAGEVPLVPPAQVDDTRYFRGFTPRVILAYQPTEAHRLYASAARGYRAGGFNAVAPSGSAGYEEEHSWAWELGAKSSFLERHVEVGLAVFRIDLSDLQLNIPLEGSPGRFYIDNAGRAHSQGVELEALARPVRGLSLQGALGVLDARFGSGSSNLGEDVDGNRLPFADRLTAFAGADYEYPIADDWRIGVHGEWVRRGDYFYEANNLEHLGAYDLLGAALWVEHRNVTLQVFGRNLTDERVIPLALPFTTASGFVGESAPPRTVGLSLAVRYR